MTFKAQTATITPMGRKGSTWVKGKGLYQHTSGQTTPVQDTHPQGFAAQGERLSTTQQSAWGRLQYAQQHGEQINLKEYRQATIDALVKKGYLRIQDYGSYQKITVRQHDQGFKYQRRNIKRNPQTAQQHLSKILQAVRKILQAVRTNVHHAHPAP